MAEEEDVVKVDSSAIEAVHSPEKPMETVEAMDEKPSVLKSVDPKPVPTQEQQQDEEVDDEKLWLLEHQYLRGDEDYDAAGGCRPCCSCPHGCVGVLAALFATIAVAFAIPAVGDCHFLTPDYLYCHPPPDPGPKYGTCGDCHCINLDKPCPSDPKEIPLIDVPNDWLQQLKSVKAKNPITMKCNPYNATGDGYNCTDPPMVAEQVELWETAVCGHHYDMTSLDDNQCPTEYDMVTYNSEKEMLDAGAQMTHWGACGACSTARDFAVYLEYPDLTAKGQECSVRFLASNFAEGVKCFQEVGYTYDCAVMWMYNVINTRDKCFDVCIDFTFFEDGFNNGPPPECKIANCLLCDEQMSGPYFQTFAARSRRRSGLLSKIVRSCDVILIVDHQPPCNVTQDALAAQRQLAAEPHEDDARALQGQQSSTKITAPPKWTPPEPTETCIFITTPLGLRGFEEPQTNEFLIPKAFLESDEREMISQYSGCRAFEFDSVMGGFWEAQRDIFGSAYNFALTLGIIGNILGFIIMVLMWLSALCIASRARFWRLMTVFSFISGACMILTLTFFASGVCENGCKIGQSAGYAIASGVIWFFAGILAANSSPVDSTVPKAECCCCPTIDGNIKAPDAYSTHPRDEVIMATEMVVTEKELEDGSKVVEKITTQPNGARVVERTIYKKD